MANIFSNSLAVFKESFAVLCKDKKMLLFPVLAGIACCAAILSFILPAFLAFEFLGLFSLLIIFACYLALYFICIFFSSAMVAYATLRLDNGKPSVLEAIKTAGKSISCIFRWALFAATVGIILETIDKITRERFVFLTSLLGTAWSLATFFVLPVVVFEKKGPMEALKSSAALFKKRWGEAITGITGIGLTIIILGIAGLLSLVGIISIAPGAIAMSAFFIFIAYVIFLSLLYISLNSIYTAALYRFAVTGEIKGGFSEAAIRNAALKKAGSA